MEETRGAFDAIGANSPAGGRGSVADGRAMTAFDRAITAFRHGTTAKRDATTAFRHEITAKRHEITAKHVAGYNDLAPMWFLAGADEVSRAVARKGCPEGSMAQFYDYSSLFNAKAFALKESRQELEKYLDVPGVWRGDLFYIQNLVATIEAKKQ